jgi:hypothetical protein
VNPPFSRESNVTCVVTSCGRHDLLQDTLESFFQYNTYPLRRMIVVEDGAPIPRRTRQLFANYDLIKWISTGENVGQIAAIDYAYSRVNTPYIFHLEDDWLFYRESFIEQSMKILVDHPKCLNVWIRALNDTNGHPIVDCPYISDGVPWRRLAFGYWGVWHGFTFNPSLRRLSDYTSINGYGIHVRGINDHRRFACEEAISKLYRGLDYYAAIIADRGGAGFVRHIGGGRSLAMLKSGNNAPRHEPAKTV